MITKEEIKKVEKLQKLEEEIKSLEEDYGNSKLHRLYHCGVGLNLGFFNERHEKDLARIIKHKILKLKRKRKELLEGK